MSKKREVTLKDLEGEEIPDNSPPERWPIDSVLKAILQRKKGRSVREDISTSRMMEIVSNSGFWLKQSSTSPEPKFVYFVDSPPEDY